MCSCSLSLSFLQPLKVFRSKELGSPIYLDNAEAYGTNQDGGGGIVVSDTRLEMHGNSWMSFPFQYLVTKNTVLEFDFTLNAEAEGHAICLDEDKNEDVELPKSRRCFHLAGSQSATWKEVWKLTATEEGEGLTHYKVDIGATQTDGRLQNDAILAYIYPGTTINYLAFIQDNDSDPEMGESVFSNVVIYDDVVCDAHHN
jgi:hypothetical protein